METLLFDGVNTPVLQERPTGFLRTLYQEKHCQLGPKGTEMGRNEERMTLRAEPQLQRPERVTTGPRI